MFKDLAFTRDAISAIGQWHGNAGIEYDKSLQMKLIEVEGASGMHLLWNKGQIPMEAVAVHPDHHVGLVAAGSVLGPWVVCLKQVTLRCGLFFLDNLIIHTIFVSWKSVLTAFWPFGCSSSFVNLAWQERFRAFQVDRIVKYGIIGEICGCPV